MKNRSARGEAKFLLLGLIMACLMFIVDQGTSWAGAYQPCSVPPVVGSATRPNVVIAMDYSGSMQFPAYFGDDDVNFHGYHDPAHIVNFYDTNLFGIYAPNTSYYGTFESDKYYVYESDLANSTEYFRLATPQPVSQYAFTAESKDGGGGTSIEFTAAGHNFQVGHLVAVYDLTSHKSLNGNAYPVTEVSGDRFKIAKPWNGKADKVAGYAIKRIYGSLVPDSSGNVIGVSGNVLNFAVTSRADAALKALIGGKAICPSGENYCYLRAQGSRTLVKENTNLQAEFYVRPSSLEATVNYPNNPAYPNDYDRGSYYKDEENHERDVVVSITGKYSGRLTATSPVYFAKYFEEWTFTLTKRTRVLMTLDGQWPGNDYIAIYTQPLAHNGDNNSYRLAYDDNSSPATIDTYLDAGTYYVRATYQTSVLDPAYQRPYTLDSNVHITPYQVSGFTNNGVMDSKIGAIPWARVRVRLEPDGPVKDTRKGVIQRSWAYVRFAFIYYKGVNGHYGKQAVGCDNDDMSKLINALEGVGSAFGIDYTQIYPYNGTPSGDSLEEAYDYLRQINTYSNADNSYFINKGSLKDPYYGANVVGAAAAVPCRKSYVLLLSDGIWNSSVDPVRPARQLHTEDLRSDLAGSQSAEVFSILAFSQDQQGYNSMKGVAMFGGFRDVTGCNASYPYPLTGYPSDSKSMTWPNNKCHPNPSVGQSYDDCCKEWDTVWDRDEDGTNEQKGDPDNYFEASDGKKLEEALLAVMAAVSKGNAAASAVATVSQEIRSSDIVVRGVFEAGEQEKVDTYLWKGHLEWYKPFKLDDEDIYDFDPQAGNEAGTLCMEITGTRHCWDAGDILKANTPVNSAQRNIITWDPVNKVQKNFHRDYISRIELSVATDGDRDDLINWVRGENVTGLRQRSAEPTEAPWKLGDIVYSTPVIVGPPRLGDVSRRDPQVNQFLQYRDDQKTRPKVVYVGGNDGMLHAFLLSTTDDGLTWKTDPTQDPNIGKELWAYIPSNLLTELKVLANTAYGSTGCKHRSMVDLSSRAWEVYIKSNYCGADADLNGRCWRTIIVGGERGGGDVYFGIDVTKPVPDALDPTSGPKVLWEYSILKNRVVVEAPASGIDPNCVQQCRSNCQATCFAEYTTCFNNCRATGKSKSKCRNLCEPPQVICQTTCEGTCESSCTLPPGDFKCYVPFRSAYDSIKLLPMTWSQPYLGRIKIPSAVKFYVGDPNPATGGGDPDTFVQFPTGSDPNNDKRAVVFMGGGIHIYDKDFDSTPAIDERFKLSLFWPFLLMMDIETGNNLFEYVWPVVLNKNIANFNVKTAGANTIPYAMSDPLCLDVWDQENDTIGDDGYIDRIYVGDMNGYLYGIKFNLDDHFPNGATSNANFGIQVELWPTKPVLNDDLGTDDYRSGLQPITVSPVASFEEILSTTTMPALRVIFGTGKYDDIFESDSDKQDTARMTLYNLRDSIMTEVGGVTYGLPIINPANSHEVYDSNHRTNFRVQFVPRCGLPNNIVSFNNNCNWIKNATDSDCCQISCSSSCYQCIYDLRHPCLTGTNGCIFPTDSIENKPGERIIGKPLIAGGIVFFTTYIPPADPCGFDDQGLLYAFDYMCVPLRDNIIDDPTLPVPPPIGPEIPPPGRVGDLGSGVPSRPVLDSRGENVIIQMSNGELKRRKVDLGDKKPLQFRGWRTR